MLRFLFRFAAALFVCALFLIIFLLKPAFIGSDHAGAAKEITITTTSTMADVADQLARKGLIDSALGYRLYAKFDSQLGRFKAGSYQLLPGQSYRAIARLIALGQERHESSVTMIEGWTVDDEARALAEQKGIPIAQTQKLIGVSRNIATFDPILRSDYPFLSSLPRDRSLEGYLFPDTYRVWDDQLPEGLIQKQLDEFQRRYGEVDSRSIKAPLHSLDDVIKLASIVEKEVNGATDRRHVAGIFLNRLTIGMALQTDASLNYALQSGRAQASAHDLASDSPYNTYTNRGLPPSPISNPGATAIDAVLNPLNTDDIYFLTDKQGNVLYAKTLEEHTRNRPRAGY